MPTERWLERLVLRLVDAEPERSVTRFWRSAERSLMRVARSDERWLERIALREAVSHLSQRERNILSMRFFQGKTQMEVSAEIGISQAQVSRLEKNALRQIRKEM